MKWTSLEEMDVDDNEEFEFELDVNDNKIVNTRNDSKSTDGADKKVEESVDEETDEEEDNKEEESTEKNVDKKTNKETRRIKALARRNKELEQKVAAAADLERKFKELEQKISNNSSNTEIETNIKTIESKVNDAKRKLVKAKQESDYEAEAEAQAEISEHTIALTVAKATRNRQPVVKEQETVVENETVPEAYRDWVEDKEWFVNPEGPDERRLKRFLSQRGKELHNEGISWDSDDFYDELDAAKEQYLKKRGLAIDEDGIVKKAAEPDKKSKQTPITSQSNRGDSSVVRSGKNKYRVRLTSDEKEMAKRLGVSEVDYAKEKIRIEKSTGSMISLED